MNGNDDYVRLPLVALDLNLLLIVVPAGANVRLDS
jgi:hypothetical protein